MQIMCFLYTCYYVQFCPYHAKVNFAIATTHERAILAQSQCTVVIKAISTGYIYIYIYIYGLSSGSAYKLVKRVSHNVGFHLQVCGWYMGKISAATFFWPISFFIKVLFWVWCCQGNSIYVYNTTKRIGMNAFFLWTHQLLSNTPLFLQNPLILSQVVSYTVCKCPCSLRYP